MLLIRVHLFPPLFSSLTVRLCCLGPFLDHCHAQWQYLFPLPGPARLALVALFYLVHGFLPVHMTLEQNCPGHRPWVPGRVTAAVPVESKPLFKAVVPFAQWEGVVTRDGVSMLRASANQRSRTHSPHTLREAAVPPVPRRLSCL